MALIVGHRGARNLWAENSLQGFRRTLALGVKSVEFDVHRTSDGTLVVIHDPTLERTTNASGAVGKLTAAEVCGATLKNGNGDRVPTLEQVLDVFGGTKVELQIEIKTDVNGNAYKGLERQLLDLLVARNITKRSVVTSFVPAILEETRRLRPGQRLLASLDRRSAEMIGGLEAALARFGALEGCMLAVEKSLLQHCLPQCLAQFGAERLGVWILNEPDEFDAWRSTPLHQITTDRPDLGLA